VVLARVLGIYYVVDFGVIGRGAMKKDGLGKPATPRDWALYRATLDCKVGRDVLDGKFVPAMGAPIEYAFYNMFHALENVALAMRMDAGRADDE